MSNSYEEIKKQLKNANMNTPCTGTNEDGELIIIESGRDDAGLFYKLTTCQKNNWCRENTYYQNGDQTERYCK